MTVSAPAPSSGMFACAVMGAFPKAGGDAWHPVLEPQLVSYSCWGVGGGVTACAAPAAKIAQATTMGRDQRRAPRPGGTRWVTSRPPKGLFFVSAVGVLRRLGSRND